MKRSVLRHGTLYRKNRLVPLLFKGRTAYLWRGQMKRPVNLANLLLCDYRRDCGESRQLLPGQASCRQRFFLAPALELVQQATRSRKGHPQGLKPPRSRAFFPTAEGVPENRSIDLPDSFQFSRISRISVLAGSTESCNCAGYPFSQPPRSVFGWTNGL